MKKLLIKFLIDTYLYKYGGTHTITYHYSWNTDTLSIPSSSELQNFCVKIWLYYIFSNLLYRWNVPKIQQWLNFDWLNKSRFSLNLERWKLQVKLKGKILQVNQFTPVGNTMDLFWLMHEVLFVEMVNILRFLFLFFFCSLPN